MNRPTGYVDLTSSAPSKERNSTDIEYIKLCYTDVVARIAEQKIHLMQIVRWAAGINVLAIGFFYSSIAANMSKYFAIVPIVVGIVGVLNYAARTARLESSSTDAIEPARIHGWVRRQFARRRQRSIFERRMAARYQKHPGCRHHCVISSDRNSRCNKIG